MAINATQAAVVNATDPTGGRVLPLPGISKEELLRLQRLLASEYARTQTTTVTLAFSTEPTTAQTTENLSTTGNLLQTIFPSGGNSATPINASSDLVTTSFQAETTQSTTGFMVTPSFKIPQFLPLYCDKKAVLDCSRTPLSACDYCSQPCAAAFLAVIVILALVIMIANSVVILAVMKKKRKSKLENMDLHRVSLAVADILTGVQILIIPAFNFVWTMNSSSYDIISIQLSYINSPAAKLGGIFFVFTYTASLFNLLYLAAQRLYAFVRPIHYKLQQKKTVGIGLVVMWLLAAVTATVPAWVPHDLSYDFAPSTFLFYPTTKKEANLATVFSLMGIMYVLPYLITVAMIFASACIVFEHMKASSKPVTTYSSPKDENSNNGEIQFFITSALMIVGFSLVSLPIVGVVIYQYTTGANVDLAFVICFYVSMANSLVNVLVYSTRDPKFRKSVKEMFCTSCGQYTLEKGVLSKRKRAPSASESFTNTGTTSNGNRKASTKTG